MVGGVDATGSKGLKTCLSQWQRVGEVWRSGSPPKSGRTMDNWMATGGSVEIDAEDASEYQMLLRNAAGKAGRRMGVHGRFGDGVGERGRS